MTLPGTVAGPAEAAPTDATVTVLGNDTTCRGVLVQRWIVATHRRCVDGRVVVRLADHRRLVGVRSYASFPTARHLGTAVLLLRRPARPAPLPVLVEPDVSHLAVDLPAYPAPRGSCRVVATTRSEASVSCDDGVVPSGGPQPGEVVTSRQQDGSDAALGIVLSPSDGSVFPVALLSEPSTRRLLEQGMEQMTASVRP